VQDVRVSKLFVSLAWRTKELEVSRRTTAIIDVLKDHELLFDIMLLKVSDTALRVRLEVLFRLDSLKRGRLLLGPTVKALDRLLSI
jgi:hypothetical protein